MGVVVDGAGFLFTPSVRTIDSTTLRATAIAMIVIAITLNSLVETKAGKHCLELLIGIADRQQSMTYFVEVES